MGPQIIKEYTLFISHTHSLSLSTGMPILMGTDGKEDGAFNELLMLGKENCDKLMTKKYQSWSMKEDGWLENDLENRGVCAINLPYVF